MPEQLTFDGDPYDLVAPLEAVFGSLVCYRAPGPVGRRELRFASLRDAWQIWPDGIRRGGERFAGDLRELLVRLAGQVRANRDRDRDLWFALSYDLVWQLRAAERVPGPPPGPSTGLLGVVALVQWAAVWREEQRRLLVDPTSRAEVAAAVAAVRPSPPVPTGPLTRVVSDLDPPRYHRQVASAREYLRRGDIYQVVISQPVRVRPYAGVPGYFRQVSHRYRTADFSYWFSLAGTRVFGNCSLPHVITHGRQIMTRVFAGTQPAAQDAAELDTIGGLLRTDPKYYSEHIMLVDLERNDLGRFCRTGTVRVDRILQPLVIGPTTYLSSTVSGELPAEPSLADVLLANFPRGVVVGAPKLRAQEIISELEGEPRGFYAGAVGVLAAASGDVVSNTIVTCGQQDGAEVVLRCGGGVIYRSDPEQELRELQWKLRYLR